MHDRRRPRSIWFLALSPSLRTSQATGMPTKECSLLHAKPGICNPSASHSRRVIESISSLLDNLKYCRPKQDIQQSLVPLKEKRRAASVAQGRHSSSSSSSSNSSSDPGRRQQQVVKPRRKAEFEHNSGILDVGRLSQSTDESEEGVSDLHSVIDELGSSNSDRRRHAAENVKRLAKCNPKVGMSLVKMGVITPLISMLDAGNEKSVQNSALLALLNLSIGTNVNKAAIVTAGAVPKMVKLSRECSVAAVQENLAGVFLSLSALDVNKPVIGNSGAVPALMNILKQGSSLKSKRDALKALYNLSIFHGNVKVIVDANIIQSLLDMIYHPELVETAVDLLGNLSATEAGRRAIVEKQDAVLILVDVLGWADSPKCQEKAVSVLMTMAHRSRALRQAIARCGAVSALLELSMLGSTIAQKVAAWILDCLRQDEELGKSTKSCGEFQDFLQYEEPQPGKFVHRILQQKSKELGKDNSEHFISIAL